MLNAAGMGYQGNTREGGWETFNKSNAIKYKGMWLYKKSWDILVIEWMKIKMESKYMQKKLIGLEDDEELEIVVEFMRFCKHQCTNMVEITANEERDKKMYWMRLL